MRINIERLMQDIEFYAKYGSTLNQGITRPSFSEDDYKVREIFIDQLKNMGLSVSIDPIANIWGRLEGSQKQAQSIVIGSHLDTVPNGGKFDGALGVLAAKEIIQTLIDHQRVLKHPVEIVSFTAEEPNDFNISTMGSRALAGKLSYETLSRAKNSKQEDLASFVARAGGNLEELSAIQRKDIAAYLELHIEQGQRLERKGLSIGVVDGIVGIYRDVIIVEGSQNHSGTTMMIDRRDALVASSKIVTQVDEIARKYSARDAVATVGAFNVYPNAANIIPGRVELIFEIRSVFPEDRDGIKEEVHAYLSELEDQSEVKISIENILNQPEAVFDQDMVGFLCDAATSLQLPYTVFPSMAGHDATHLADISKTAMIFVKSIGGISHHQDELSLPADIEAAANTLLQALLLADQALD